MVLPGMMRVYPHPTRLSCEMEFSCRVSALAAEIDLRVDARLAGSGLGHVDQALCCVLQRACAERTARTINVRYVVGGRAMGGQT